ncbi:MAG TPA: hypothetical protein PLI43_09945 [Albidovulum sp.]|nr:hypothetical protein [Albidovulum sp.]
MTKKLYIKTYGCQMNVYDLIITYDVAMAALTFGSFCPFSPTHAG